MIVQIYSLTHPDDVRVLMELGVDHIGLAPAGQGLRSELGLEESRALFDLLPPNVLGAALTVRTDLDAIVAMAEVVKDETSHWTDDDRAAVAEYLATVPPLADEAAPPTKEPAQGG